LSVITNVVFNQQEKSRNEVTTKLNQQKLSIKVFAKVSMILLIKSIGINIGDTI